uniref:AlNc14C7G959 protein n=1 Tax=Albugo laibachii Nc14 TaxID=890382 RepID=F0W1J1_9STRA|nr:AlNc14C7G959 [Albugo laibachii Nc14]|eukprot:CCA14920.1 AlNc14C7G959 [Albugo laibachii Nc14]
MRDQIRSVKNRLSCNGFDALGSESFDCRMTSMSTFVCSSEHIRSPQESTESDKMKRKTCKPKQYARQSEFLLFCGYENNEMSYLPTYPCDTDRTSSINVRHSMPVFFYNLPGTLSCTKICKSNEKPPSTDQ